MDALCEQLKVNQRQPYNQDDKMTPMMKIMRMELSLREKKRKKENYERFTRSGDIKKTGSVHFFERMMKIEKQQERRKIEKTEVHHWLDARKLQILLKQCLSTDMDN